MFLFARHEFAVKARPPGGGGQGCSHAATNFHSALALPLSLACCLPRRARRRLRRLWRCRASSPRSTRSWRRARRCAGGAGARGPLDAAPPAAAAAGHHPQSSCPCPTSPLPAPARPRAPALPQDGTITKKNSPARNVHRLLNTLSFIAAIFENLAKGMGLKVRGGARGGAAAGCCRRAGSCAARSRLLPPSLPPPGPPRAPSRSTAPHPLPHRPSPPSCLGRGERRVRPHAGGHPRVGGAHRHQGGHGRAAQPRPLPGLHWGDGCAAAGTNHGRGACCRRRPGRRALWLPRREH